MSKQFQLTPNDHGKRLLAFLRERCPSVSVKQLKRSIDEKGCIVNGRVERISTRTLTVGDSVQVNLVEKREELKASILYEDDALLICDKPVCVVSDNRSFCGLFPEKNSLELVHRLDKETSGAIILAKTPKMREEMMRLFAEREIEKLYLAIVDGEIKQDEGVIDNLLIKKETRGGQSFFGSSPTRGQRAVTHWKCKKRGGGASLLLCRPVTGRTHQIRVHLKEVGHPILGDVHYGKRFKCSWKTNRHLLHASFLSFVHPTSKERLKIAAPIPDDFKLALRELFDL